jgi:hypothetical protein
MAQGNLGEASFHTTDLSWADLPSADQRRVFVSYYPLHINVLVRHECPLCYATKSPARKIGSPPYMTSHLWYSYCLSNS